MVITQPQHRTAALKLQRLLNSQRWLWLVGLVGCVALLISPLSATSCSTVCINNQCEQQCLEPDQSDTSDLSQRRWDFRAFSSVSIAGINAEIRHNENFSILASGSSKILDKLAVSIDGDTLAVNLQSGVYSNKDRTTVVINMPDLRQLDISGSEAVQLYGFSADQMAINLSGASALVATDNRINRVELSASGENKVDWNKSLMQQLDLLAQGANQLSFNFADNGIVNGSLIGANQLGICGSPHNKTQSMGFTEVIAKVCN